MATSPLSAGLVDIDLELYPEDCLEQAVTAYRDLIQATIASRGRGSITIDLTVNESARDKEVVLRREFLNYLLDLAVRKHLQA